MKLKDGMVLTNIGDDFVAVSTGGADEFHGVVRMNKTGAAIWNLIAEGRDREGIARGLLDRYDGVDYASALAEADRIIAILREKGLLTD
jgi:hypothetical protein